MRSIRRGEFIVDVGCKELYNRLPEVDELWKEILQDDYRTYSHRIGVLYDFRILELSTEYRGFRRGMPWGSFLAAGVDLLWQWGKPGRRISNYQEYWYARCGARFSRAFAQGFREKFRQTPWREVPLPDDLRERPALSQRLRQGLSIGFGSASNKPVWRHPAMGTGQICETLATRTRAAGCEIHLAASAVEFVRSENRIVGVTAHVGGEAMRWSPTHVVAGLPLEVVGKLTFSERFDLSRSNASSRGTILVYLFLNEPPRFPHCWLEVTDPRLSAGRITNYAAFSPGMVPRGLTCLCVEFFCTQDAQLYTLSDKELVSLSLSECASSGILEPARCFDSFVLKLPGADASTSWRDWHTPERIFLLGQLRQIDNLYFVNRPGTDRSTHAGLKAAEAILRQDREEFDRSTDPAVDFQSDQRASTADFVRARL